MQCWRDEEQESLILPREALEGDGIKYELNCYIKEHIFGGGGALRGI